MKKVLSAVSAVLVVLLLSPPRALGQNRGEDPVYVTQDRDATERLSAMQAGHAGGKTEEVFSNLKGFLEARNRHADLCVPGPGGSASSADRSVVALLSRYDPDRVRKEIRNRDLDLSRVLSLGPGPRGLTAFLQGGSLAGAAEDEGARCLEAGNLIQALQWYSLRLDLQPAPRSQIRLLMGLCWARLGRWDRAEAQVEKIRSGPLASQADTLRRWARAPAERSALFRDPENGPSSLPLPGAMQRTLTLRVSDFDDEHRRYYRDRGDPPSSTVMIADEERVYVANTYSVEAFNKETGAGEWRFPHRPPDRVAHDLARARPGLRLWGDLLLVSGDGSLKAFHCGDGRLRWRLGRSGPLWPQSRPEGEEEDLWETGAFGRGVIHGNILYVPWIRRSGSQELSLLGLSPGGEVVFTLFLCSAKLKTVFGHTPRPEVLRFEDVLFVQSDLGAIFAVDLVSRRILWVRTYDRAPLQARNLLRRLEAHRPFTPVKIEPMILFGPADGSDFLALDAVGGDLCWRCPRAGVRTVLRGEEGRIYLVGSKIRVLDGVSGRLFQECSLPDGAAGSAVLGRDKLLVPLPGRVVCWGLDEHPVRTVLRIDKPEFFDLVLGGGGLQTVSPLGVGFLEDRSASLTRARALLEKDSLTDRSRAMEIFRTLCEREQAWTAAERLLSGDPPPGLRRRVDDMLRSWFEEARAAGTVPEFLLDRIELSATSPILSLEAELYRLRGDISAGRVTPALRRMAALIKEHGSRRLSDPDPRTVREVVRELAGRLAVRYPGDELCRRGAGAIAAWDARGSPSRSWTGDLLPGTLRGESARLDLAGDLLRANRRRDGLTLLTGLALEGSGKPRAGAAARLLEEGWKRGWPAFARPWLYPGLWSGLPGPEEGSPPGPGFFAADARWFHTAPPPYRRMWHFETLLGDEPVRVVKPLGLSPQSWRVAFLGTGETLLCIDLWTGRACWLRRTGTRMGPSAVFENCFVYSLPDRLVALDMITGGKAWEFLFGRFSASDKVGLFPHRGSLIVTAPSVHGKAGLFRLSAQGRKVWKAALPARGRFALTPLPGGSGFLLHSHRGDRLVVDFRTGGVTVRPSIGAALDRPALLAEVYPGGGPAVLGRMTAAGGNQIIWREDRDTGKVTWSKTLANIQAARGGPDYGGLFVVRRHPVSGLEGVWISADSGEILWKRKLRLSRLASARVHPRHLAVLKGRDHRGAVVTVLSLADGRELWTGLCSRQEDPALSWGSLAMPAGLNRIEIRNLATGALEQTLSGPWTAVNRAGFLPGGVLFAATQSGTDIFLPAVGPLAPYWPDPHDGEVPHRRVSAYLTQGRPGKAQGLFTSLVSKNGGLRFGREDAAFFNLRGLWEEAARARRPQVAAYRFSRPPEVDGLLDENTAPAGIQHLTAPVHLDFVRGSPVKGPLWRGPYDLSARLYTGWDDTFFYVTLEIDDQYFIQADGKADHLNGDITYLAFDMALDGGTSMGNDDLVLISASWKKDTSPFPKQAERKLKQQNHQTREKEDGSGVVYENAIPWDYINDHLKSRGLSAHVVRPRPGVRFGFNVARVDDDGRGAKTILRLAPGLSFGWGDRPGRMSFGAGNALFKFFFPCFFAEVVLR